MANGHPASDSYSGSSYNTTAVNGTKRPREDDDLDYKPRGGSGADLDSLKRRRSGHESSIGDRPRWIGRSRKCGILCLLST